MIEESALSNRDRAVGARLDVGGLASGCDDPKAMAATGLILRRWGGVRVDGAMFIMFTTKESALRDVVVRRHQTVHALFHALLVLSIRFLREVP